MDYFSERSNPFYDRQCNNEVIKMQRLNPEQLRWVVITGHFVSTAITDLNLYWIKGALAFICFSFFFSGYMC